MKKTKELKELLRRIYKKKRLEDGRIVGRQINELTQAIHLQLKFPKEEQDEKVLVAAMQSLAEIRKEHRFRDDFQTFRSFYDYITKPKNGFTLEDVKEL